jgi:SAM-dependent methyltransferase
VVRTSSSPSASSAPSRWTTTTFDVVHAHQVLQHLSDPVRALREMKRVCKPAGWSRRATVTMAPPAGTRRARDRPLAGPVRKITRRNDTSPTPADSFLHGRTPQASTTSYPVPPYGASRCPTPAHGGVGSVAEIVPPKPASSTASDSRSVRTYVFQLSAKQPRQQIR